MKKDRVNEEKKKTDPKDVVKLFAEESQYGINRYKQHLLLWCYSLNYVSSFFLSRCLSLYLLVSTHECLSHVSQSLGFWAGRSGLTASDWWK